VRHEFWNDVDDDDEDDDDDDDDDSNGENDLYHLTS
jgi:hypothetical protein